MDGFSKLDIFQKNKNVQNEKTQRNVFSGTRKIFLFLVDFQQSMNGAKKENGKMRKKVKKIKNSIFWEKTQKITQIIYLCDFSIFCWVFLKKNILDPCRYLIRIFKK